MNIEDRSYLKSEVASFLRTSETFGAFSNMHAGYPMRIGDLELPSTEALYQALRYPHLPDFQREIIEQEKPVLSKRHAYKRIKETRADWLDVNFKIMRYAIELKCASYPERMRDLFEKTQGKPIVEISNKDDFWGTFLRGDVLQGKNVLGRLLMERRELHLASEPGVPLMVRAPSFRDAKIDGILISDLTPEPLHSEQAGFNF